MGKKVKVNRDAEKNSERVSLQMNKWLSLLSCLSSEAEPFDDTEFKPEYSSEYGETRSMESNDIITLSESPKIIYWNRQVKLISGTGTFYQGKHERRLATVKRVPVTSFQTTERETSLLSRLDGCENIIRYFCTLQDKEYNFIITQCYQKSLRRCLKQSDMPGKEILRQLCNAVKFLHNRNIVHLKLNPESVRVVMENGVQRVKLVDFSSAAEVIDCDVITGNYSGIKGFVAPEIILKQQAHLSADIYSLGCLFFYVQTKGEIFPRIHNFLEEFKSVWKIYKLMETQNYDEILAAGLMKRMLKFSQKKRPNIDNVVQHPFFWSTSEIFSLILSVNKKFEDKSYRDEKQSIIETNKEQIIGTDWKLRLHVELQTKSYDGTSIVDLVRVIRNHQVHSRSENLIAIMGTSDTELKEYFFGKFPHLIPHLHRMSKKLV